MIVHSSKIYGRDSKNFIEQVRQPGIERARALIETFYYAFNQHDSKVFAHVWADHELIQLNNPLGGMLRGYEPIFALYQRIFTGLASVWVEFSDIVEFQTAGMVVFAGREHGEFVRNGESLGLKIRTSRIVMWTGAETGWRRTHHHGSIDEPSLLSTYQAAVR